MNANLVGNTDLVTPLRDFTVLIKESTEKMSSEFEKCKKKLKHIDQISSFAKINAQSINNLTDLLTDMLQAKAPVETEQEKIDEIKEKEAILPT